MYDQVNFKDFRATYESFDKWSVAHKHSSFEMFLLTEGEQTIRVGNRKYTLKPGCIFLLYPDIEHKYIGDKPYTRYEISFTNKFLDMFFTSFLCKRLLRCFTSEVIQLTESEVNRFISLYEEMETAKKMGEDYPIQFASILCMLNGVSERKEHNPIQVEDATKEEAALVNVVAYINAHYREIHSMDEITQACFISKSYLCSIFKETYGMTVMDYLRKTRIRSACTFLATTDKNFSLIARKLGFVDLSHFTRVFKKEMGMSPKEYRNQKKQKREKKQSETK